MYAITDVEVLHLLEKKGETVPLKILYDPRASADLTHLSGAEPVKGSGLMHQKILVLDNERVFLGSANLTLSSLTMHDNFVAGFFYPPLAHFLTSESPSPFSFKVGDQYAELWLLPEEEGHALKRLIHYIDHAKKSINVSLFTFTHPELCEALVRASLRGVSVALAIDYYTGQGASLKTVETLLSHSIPVYISQGKQLLHYKWAFIDESTWIFGSANWTQAAFTKNKDYFLILENLTKEQRERIYQMWETLKVESL